MPKRNLNRIMSCRQCGTPFNPSGFKQTCCSDLCALRKKLIVGAPNECWGWRGGQIGGGYGVFTAQRDGPIFKKYGVRHLAASRAAYILLKGDFDRALLVRHTCDNRKCCNPDHLILGTHKDNTADMFSRGRASPTRGFLRWKPTDKDGNVYVTEKMREFGADAVYELLAAHASAEEIAIAAYKAMTEERVRFINYKPKTKHENARFHKGLSISDIGQQAGGDAK